MKLTKEQRQVYSDVRERDNNRCQVCDKRGDEVHHIFTRAAYPNLKYDKNNLILLCKKHHNYAGAYQNQFKKWFADEYPERWEYLLKIKNKVKYKRN